MPQCQNCQNRPSKEFFEHVKGGIHLCDECADLPVTQVEKKETPSG